MIRWLKKKLTPPSIHPIIAEIDRRGLYLLVHKSSYSGNYSATIETNLDGIKCEVSGSGPTFDAALSDAWRKWP